MEGTSLLFASSSDSHSDVQPTRTNCNENIPQLVVAAEATSTCNDGGAQRLTANEPAATTVTTMWCTPCYNSWSASSPLLQLHDASVNPSGANGQELQQHLVFLAQDGHGDRSRFSVVKTWCSFEWIIEEKGKKKWWFYFNKIRTWCISIKGGNFLIFTIMPPHFQMKTFLTDNKGNTENIKMTFLIFWLF